MISRQNPLFPLTYDSAMLHDEAHSNLIQWRSVCVSISKREDEFICFSGFVKADP